MNIRPLFFILLFFAKSSMGTDEGPPSPEPDVAHFRPHLISNPQVLEPWMVTFNPYPGSFARDSFLLNSLDLGLPYGFQIGTTPLAYFSRDHMFNGNIKYQILRSNKYVLAAGATAFFLKFKEPLFHRTPSGREPFHRAQVFFAGLSGAYAWDPRFPIPGAAFNIATVRTYFIKRNLAEWMVDLSYEFHHQWWITPGFGQIQDGDNYILGLPQWSYGVSLTKKWDGKYFYQQRLGIQHFIKSGENAFLFSISIL